jgi:archaellum component FlaC
MSTPTSTPTPQQVDELFNTLNNTFANAKQDMVKAKESANHISETVDDLRSTFEEQVRIIRIYRSLIMSHFPI